jgi:hypothetical protein
MARPADFKAAGITAATVTRMQREAEIVRITRILGTSIDAQQSLESARRTARRSFSYRPPVCLLTFQATTTGLR